MSLKQDLHCAYVLHTRPYRETSMLVEVLSSLHGRITLVARGAKRGKCKDSSMLQPFIPIQISWFGNGDLVTLTQVEVNALQFNLYGRSAICGMYLNELLIKLLPKWDNCEVLYNAYEKALQALARHEEQQIILRSFEMQLLKSLGYGLELRKDISGMDIVASGYYIFDPEHGLKPVQMHQNSISGTNLLAIAKNTWHSPEILLDLKRLMRMILRHHLGTKQLMSRELL